MRENDESSDNVATVLIRSPIGRIGSCRHLTSAGFTAAPASDLERTVGVEPTYGSLEGSCLTTRKSAKLICRNFEAITASTICLACHARDVKSFRERYESRAQEISTLLMPSSSQHLPQ